MPITRWIGFLTFCCLLPASAQVQKTRATAYTVQEVNQLTEQRSASAAIDNMCGGGTILDDGSYENAYRIPFSTDARFVQLLTPSSFPALLQSACVCWQTSLNAAAMNFSFVVYNTSGLAGQPGALLGTVPASVSIPTPFGTSFVGASCANLNIALNSGAVYVGAAFNSNNNVDFFLCADESPATPVATMFQSSNGGASWVPVTQNASSARALGIRAVFGSASGCIGGDTTLCLNNNRFQVTATFDAGNGNAGQAHMVALTDDTGYIWFFNAANVEAVIKLLNGCGLGGHYWVFAGGLTNVKVALTVTDMQTGIFKTYRNPANTTFLPIQDTAAFSTCP